MQGIKKKAWITAEIIEKIDEGRTGKIIGTEVARRRYKKLGSYGKTDKARVKSLEEQ